MAIWFPYSINSRYLSSNKDELSRTGKVRVRFDSYHGKRDAFFSDKNLNNVYLLIYKKKFKNICYSILKYFQKARKKGGGRDSLLMNSK
jgi:hypothetical protein